MYLHRVQTVSRWVIMVTSMLIQKCNYWLQTAKYPPPAVSNIFIPGVYTVVIIYSCYIYDNYREEGVNFWRDHVSSCLSPNKQPTILTMTRDTLTFVKLQWVIVSDQNIMALTCHQNLICKNIASHAGVICVSIFSVQTVVFGVAITLYIVYTSISEAHAASIVRVRVHKVKDVVRLHWQVASVA